MNAGGSKFRVIGQLGAAEERPDVLESYVSTSPGVLLLSSSLDAVAYNSEALQILAFPNNPRRIKRRSAFLARRVRSRLSIRSSIDGQQFVNEFRSGTRTYQCRAVNLYAGELGAAMVDTPIALLLERQPAAALSLKRRMWKEFNLSQRERQTVDLVLRGMTTKEIAGSMKVSPNTVKTYLRLIMTKMRVTTRAGIIGKILAG